MRGSATSMPYRRTGWTAASARHGIGWATDPIGNLVAEFVSDLARHVKVHLVFLQRVSYQIAREDGAEPHRTLIRIPKRTARLALERDLGARRT